MTKTRAHRAVYIRPVRTSRFFMPAQVCWQRDAGEARTSPSFSRRARCCRSRRRRAPRRWRCRSSPSPRSSPAACSRDTAGNAGPWIVFAATLLGLAIRRLDLESWTLFIPGGLSGRVERAFGPRAATAAAGVVIIERVLLGALACVVFGHYAGRRGSSPRRGYARLLRNATTADLSALIAPGAARLAVAPGAPRPAADARAARPARLAGGRDPRACCSSGRARRPSRDRPGPLALADPGHARGSRRRLARRADRAGGSSSPRSPRSGRAAPAIGVADSIPRVVHELAPPRIAGLRRAVAITSAAALLLTGGLALLGAALVPAGRGPRVDQRPARRARPVRSRPAWIHGAAGLAADLIAAAAALHARPDDPGGHLGRRIRARPAGPARHDRRSPEGPASAVRHVRVGDRRRRPGQRARDRHRAAPA